MVRQSRLDPLLAEKETQQRATRSVVPKTKAAAKKKSKNNGSKRSATEPVVSNANAAARGESTRRQRSTAGPVTTNKRKQTLGSEQSTPELVERSKTQRRASPSDPRRNLTAKNAKNANTDLVRVNQLPIKVGQTLYIALQLPKAAK